MTYNTFEVLLRISCITTVLPWQTYNAHININVRNILTLFNVPIVYGGNGLIKVKYVVLDSNLVVLPENVIIIVITFWTCCLLTLFISFKPALPYLYHIVGKVLYTGLKNC